MIFSSLCYGLVLHDLVLRVANVLACHHIAMSRLALIALL